MMRRVLLSTAFGLMLLGSPMAIAKSKLMQDATNQSPAPDQGKALVVFIRASFVGSPVEASIYDAPDASTTFLGVSSYKTRLAYQADPGVHRFMVVGENADFVDATLEAGKTYYVLVSPRMGLMKARFSLLPVHPAADAKFSTQSTDFKNWMDKTGFVETMPAAEAWYADHKADIEAKKAEYLQRWNAMAPKDREVLTIRAEDGLTDPVPAGHPQS